MSVIRDKEAPGWAEGCPDDCVAAAITSVLPAKDPDTASASLVSCLDSDVKVELLELLGGLWVTELNFSLSPAEI